MSLIKPNHSNNALNFLWNLFTDGEKELFTTKSYGLCFMDKGWRTIKHRLEHRHFNDHFLGNGRGLELIMLLVGKEFGVGLHKSLASQLVRFLLAKGYLVLLKDYVKKVRGRTLGVGEAFKALPFR